MKWTSKDGKQALDLSKVAYWKYVSKEDWAEMNRRSDLIRQREDGAWIPTYEERNTLEIYFGGDGPITFYNEEAAEIYNKLISQQEVL